LFTVFFLAEGSLCNPILATEEILLLTLTSKMGWEMGKKKGKKKEEVWVSHWRVLRH